MPKQQVPKQQEQQQRQQLEQQERQLEQQRQQLVLEQVQELRQVLVQVQVLLLSYRKQPGQQPTGRRSTEFFSWFSFKVLTKILR